MTIFLTLLDETGNLLYDCRTPYINIEANIDDIQYLPLVVIQQMLATEFGDKFQSIRTDSELIVFQKVSNSYINPILT